MLKPSRILRCFSFLVFAMVGSSAGSPVFAQESSVDPRVQASLLIKSLTYDQNLAVRCGNGVRIGVVAIEGNPRSESEAAKFLAEFKSFSDKVVKGLPIHAEACTVGDAASLFRRVDGQELNTLFLTAGSDTLLKDILGFAQAKNVLLMTSEAGYVERGVPLAVVSRAGKPRILLNLRSTAAKMVRFDSRLLQLAEQVGVSGAGGPQFQPPDEFKKRRVSGKEPEIPEVARAARVDARLVVKLQASADGDIQSVEFIQTSPYFEEAVRQAVRTWKLAPLEIDGKRVATYTVMKMDFRFK